MLISKVENKTPYDYYEYVQTSFVFTYVKTYKDIHTFNLFCFNIPSFIMTISQILHKVPKSKKLDTQSVS